ncbi:MBL fold metallo-hydrolase [Mesorhizobium sp. BAC0120]|uniref:MBL fold metallo-hydrolase n=1 Tax=Mesorhizobium sp. BAC0120 TaxID=3090670 RepID=UPI00298C48EF|nr:MBL fold metallo-hydrolase [Mesorhizobium sp. BAC0120]MDW6025669.1 MBL fold metallo-hydrolase [Mesorhizobium sp. BAC0120]
MQFTRRDTLQLGLAGLAGLSATSVMPFTARAEGKGDRYKTDSGEIVISPVQHASFVMSTPGLVIWNDPVGGKALFEGQPAPGLVLITHEHPDHFEPETLTAIVGADTRLVVNPSVMEKLPADLKAKATAIGNGQKTEVGPVSIDAVPAYNTTEDRKKYHPKGRDNGYVLAIDGRRVYIAGDTEDTPEMRAQKDIYIAFVPMNLPYTMDIDQAASAVEAFKPAFVYPYHYQGQDPKAFADKVAAKTKDTKVVLGKWYS